ncbi:MAG: glycerol kinase GlpK [Candidatus Bathyarchaeia archaeon]
MENKQYIISVDQSTSATKGILFDLKGEKIAETSLPHKQYYPKPGWVEHDPEEIFRNTISVISNLLKMRRIPEENILGLTITNQRETVVVWDKRSGKPFYNAVVWQCLRGTEICEKYRIEGYENVILEKTGLILDPYFSASKIRWVMDYVKPPPDSTLVGTIDSWLIWKLTNGKVHATDYSNASRTMLLNIRNLSWDEELLDLFGIPRSAMPELLPSNSIFGFSNCEGTLRREVPVSGVIGDSQAALFGEGCFEKGMTKVTYGTGSSIVMNIGYEYIAPPKGIVTSIGWGINKDIPYIFEGNVHATGATIRWLMENMGIMAKAEMNDIEKICFSLEDNEGVYFVPAFSGLGAPYWENRAKGIIYGLTFKTKREHIIRAAVEAIAYQIRDVLEVLTRNSGIEIREVKADGGAAKNNFLMQFQADILGIPVQRAFIDDMSAFGSFLMGGLGFGVWDNLKELKNLLMEKRWDVFSPKIAPEKREKYYSEWRKIIKKSLP